MKFFYDKTQKAININDNMFPTGTVSLIFKDNDTSVEARNTATDVVIMSKNKITNLEDSTLSNYTDKAALLNNIGSDFFS